VIIFSARDNDLAVINTSIIIKKRDFASKRQSEMNSQPLSLPGSRLLFSSEKKGLRECAAIK
jgi:hypothetical protein